MALISAKTILTSLSLFHVTLGFFFLTSPVTIADQALVYIIGESMGLPYARHFETRSPPLAFLGIVLATLGICDLVTLSLPEEISLVYHWGLQAPLRLFIALVLVFYTFFFSAASPLYADQVAGSWRDVLMRHPSAHAHTPGYEPSSWGGDGLKNRVFFTFIFVEMVSWFWIWVTLREERNQILARKAARRRSTGGYGVH